MSVLRMKLLFEKVNNEPFGEGWIVEIELSDAKELKTLLEPDVYAEQCQKELE